MKWRCFGDRLWIWLVQNGVSELIFDVVEPRLRGETGFGFRLNAGGSVDNMTFRGRESLS